MELTSIPPCHLLQTHNLNWDKIVCICDKTSNNVTAYNGPFYHFRIQNIFLVLLKHIRIYLLLSNDHHMNHPGICLQPFIAQDISGYVHIMVYMIDNIVHAVSLIKCQNTWFLLQPFPCSKNLSCRFRIELIQYFIYVLWHNHISISIYLYRH